MYDSKMINYSIAVNVIIISTIIILAILLNRISFIFLLKLIIIGSSNIVILNRVRSSLIILNRLKGLEEVDFPKYKDASMIILGLIF